MQRLRRAVAIQSTIRLHRITSLALSGTSSLITARPPCLIRTSAGTGLELNFLKRQLCPTVPAHRTDPLLDDCTSATAAREFESRCIYIRARSLRLSIAALSPPAIIVGVSPPLMACKPLRGLVKRFEMPCGRAGGGGARCRGSRNEVPCLARHGPEPERPHRPPSCGRGRRPLLSARPARRSSVCQSLRAGLDGRGLKRCASSSRPAARPVPPADALTARLAHETLFVEGHAPCFSLVTCCGPIRSVRIVSGAEGQPSEPRDASASIPARRPLDLLALLSAAVPLSAPPTLARRHRSSTLDRSSTANAASPVRATPARRPLDLVRF